SIGKPARRGQICVRALDRGVARVSDAFPLVPTGLASAGGVAVGVVLVAWLGVRPAQVPENATPESDDAPAPVADARPTPDAITAPAPPAAGTVPHDEPPPPPTAAFGPAATGRVAITPGRVAYIRCDGLGDRCPRDAAMEQSVWAVVQTLP